MRRALAVLVVLTVVAALLLSNRRDEAPPPVPTTPPTAEPEPKSPRNRAADTGTEEDEAEPIPFVSRSSGSTGADDEWTRRMTIVVTSARDKSPVERAVVRVLARFRTERMQTGETDVAGIATLGAPRRAIVIVRHPGFVTQALTPDEGRVVDATPRLDVVLVPGPTFAGRVVHAGTNGAVADAEVYAWDAESHEEIDFDAARFDHDESTGVRTKLDGTFAFNALPPGRDVVLAVRADSLGSVTRRIAAGGPAESLVIELGGGASVSGFVRDAEGRPIQGAFVYAVLRGDDFLLRIPEVRDLHSSGVKLLPRSVSAADGSYRIEGLATPAAYVVTAARDRWDRGLAEAAELLAPGATARRDVVVYDRCKISGRLVGPDGAPVDFDSFEILTTDGHRYSNPFANGSSSEGSTFTTTDVVPGEYVVEVRAKGPWPPVTVPVTVKTRGTTEIEVRFAPGVTLSGAVIDEAGTPIEGATVRAGGHDAHSGEDGTFRIEGVRAGAVTVSVRSSDDSYLTREVPNADPSGAPLRVVMSRAAAVVFRLEHHEGERGAHCLVCTVRGSRWRGQLTTENDDSYRLDGLPAGIPFDLTIRDSSGACHALTFRELQVAQGTTLDLGRIAFRPMRTLRGILLGPDGTRLSGAVVSRVDPTGATDRSVTTDPSGAFEFRGAPPHELLVEIEAPGLPRSRRFLDSETPERIQLEAGVPVTGRLLDGAGTPRCAGESVIAPAGDAGARPSSPYWETTTNSMGEFSVLLPAGRYVLFARTTVRGGGELSVFDDTPLTEFDVTAPGPVRVDARVK